MYAKKKPEVSFTMAELSGVGPGGNAFALMGKVTSALRDAKYHKDEIERFRKEATSGDFENLIETIERWVEIV